MSEFVTVTIETNPVILFDEAVEYMQTQFPDWEPNDGNLEVIMLSIYAHLNAGLRDIASDAPPAIFRYFGDTIMSIPPIDGAPATITSTWTMIDNAGYTIPQGTQVGIPASGDQLIGFHVESTVVIPPGSLATAVGAVTLVADEDGKIGNGLSTGAQLIDSLTFVATNGIALVGISAGGADPEEDDAYLDRLTTELQLMTPRPIVPNDFAVLAKRVAGVGRTTAFDLYNPTNNLLTANQSSVETDTTGFAADTNVNISRVTAQAAHGAASLQMSSVAAGDMAAGTTAGTGGFPVTPGQLYAVRIEARAATVVRNVRVGITWYTAAGATISTVEGTNAADTTTGWTERTHFAIAPPTAAFGKIRPVVSATGGAAEVHYIDKWQVREGIATFDWVIGPAPASNNERMITVAAADLFGAALPTLTKTAIKDYLESLRETNFVVNVIDPVANTVDITYSVKATTAFDTASVRDQIDAEISNYLNPATWGIPFGSTDTEQWTNLDKIRRLEIATVINNVPGVDYIVSLTIGINGGSQTTAEEFQLAGIAPLPQVNTITGTVTA